MELKRKQCERLLARMAESIGLTIVVVPANCIAGTTWHVAKKLESRQVLRLTVSYFSPKELLGRMLDYYQAFNLCGRVADNPFYGMSPEEVELRLAVVGK